MAGLWLLRTLRSIKAIYQLPGDKTDKQKGSKSWSNQWLRLDDWLYGTANHLYDQRPAIELANDGSFNGTTELISLELTTPTYISCHG